MTLQKILIVLFVHIICIIFFDHNIDYKVYMDGRRLYYYYIAIVVVFFCFLIKIKYFINKSAREVIFYRTSYYL